jgi:protein-tyrosine-phosphatase
MTKVHFICTGNIYRSRLGETYLNSKKIPEVIVNSSGIKAGEEIDDAIGWYSLEIIKENHLEEFMAPTWQKTTLELLKNVDIIIFMTKLHYDFVTQTLGYIPKKYEIWEIKDITAQEIDSIKKETRDTFSKIKAKVDSLAISLSK